MDTGHRSPARLLAPIALVVFGIALTVTLVSAGEKDRSKSASEASREERRDLKTKRERRERRREERRERSSRSTYVVQTGDTLGGISDQTGVSVEKLQELNPTLDPQALVSGQRIKLR
jgi:hypothetical protein